MPEYGGLQIEVRCVKCGRLPTADVLLFEMQNHLYICTYCRREAEGRGKNIAWVHGVQMQSLLPVTPSLPLAMPATPARTRQLTSNLPPNSVWARLELPLDAPLSQIKQAVREQIQLWSKKPDSAEKRTRIAILRECMEQLQDEEAFEEERERLRAITRKEGSALSVGGKAVLTAAEFLDACERTQEGWADGERYLRTGELSQWILFQLGERELAVEARNYQKLTGISDFRALNEMLYCLVLTRAFRLYKHEAWQKLDTIPSAETPSELAMLCDIHWEIAVPHLYEGSMLFWLEHSRGIRGMQAYYESAAACYMHMEQDRGVGLELVLERAVPGLEKPQLVVDFDDERGSYHLKNWDREIPHKAISVTITNVTRGFTSLDLALQGRVDTIEPDWISMYSSTSLRGRPGAGMPGTVRLDIHSLPQLRRGRTYRRKFYVRSLRENRQVKEQVFPIELKMMSFFRGMRGRLWAWGLRGDIPGLLWNAVAGGILALLVFWLIPALVPQSVFNWVSQLANGLSLGTVLQAILAGLVNVLHFDAFIPGHHVAFPLVVAAMLGFVGFWTGIGKGYDDYKERKNAAGFRKGAGWLAVLFTLYLLFPDGGYRAIGAAFQYGGSSYYGSDYKNYLILSAIQYCVSALLAWLLIFLLACLLAFIHYRLERYVRNQNRALLDPPGRQ
ncbi:MAG TPA: hypothetical protein VJO32_05390 [Ktedonobacteraceae bacterium]|nr:hypothetical protein [Ktedonobacteraceae bacterium]